LQPKNLIVTLIAIVTPVTHIGVREVFDSFVVFT
jgi:hypothetical protein